MTFAHNGAVRLYFETFGRADAPAILLINGAGRQCIDFSVDFCAALVEAGLRVVRFDARDTGLSTGFAHSPANLPIVFDAATAGEPATLVYDLDDLIDDALAIMDAIGAGRFHLVGRSLGSAVAQRLALRHPERVCSLSLIMAFSRGLWASFPRERMVALEAEPVMDEAAYVARQVRAAQASGSPAYLDLDRVATEASAAYQRGVHPGGVARHFAVGVATPDLRPDLAALRVPTLVIHGALDPLIPLALAEETAAAIPGARLEVLADMAHDGPPQLQMRWAGLIAELLTDA